MTKDLAFTMHDEQDRRIVDALEQQRPRLRQWLRRQAADPGDVEDVLQDVFYELVAAYRLLQPVEQAGAWLFRVARNRLVDRWRKKKPEAFADHDHVTEEGERLGLADLLPSPEAGPDAAYARSVLVEELEDALAELPDAQREVFLAHEVEGRSFKEIAARTGVGVNTLLSRKHAAVLQLRQRLRAVYDEFLTR
ncbi:MAG TPA: RNA polymerase sigma factor [Thermoanaerobaculia bacterium]|nr:RNA polymerase sigma factor [Thermoanaerobaculia bacterium]